MRSSFDDDTEVPMNIAVRLWLLAALVTGSITAHARCELGDIDVEITKAVWHNRCSKKECIEFRGSALLTSRCDESAAVQIRLVGHDASGAPIAVREMWPYSISNVPPGEFPFSIDLWLKYQPDIRGFDIAVTQVRPVTHK
jgi:hypothetical protein